MTKYKIIVSYFDYRGFPSEDVYNGLIYEDMLDKMEELNRLLDEGKINGYIIKEYHEDIYRKKGVLATANYSEIRRKANKCIDY